MCEQPDRSVEVAEIAFAQDLLEPRDPGGGDGGEGRGLTDFQYRLPLHLQHVDIFVLRLALAAELKVDDTVLEVDLVLWACSCPPRHLGHGRTA